jgi:SAM-dependent methyltransferase
MLPAMTAGPPLCETGADAVGLMAAGLSNGRLNRAALALLNPRAGEVVLEIGCGAGAALRRVARMVGPQGFVAGVDRSCLASRLAAQAIGARILDGQAFVMQGEAHAMPFRDMMFDKVFAVNTFSHWRAPARGLREVARVLRPGGRLVITQRAGEGAEEGFDDVGRAALLLKHAGWTLIDERADRDGEKYLALSLLARRAA